MSTATTLKVPTSWPGGSGPVQPVAERRTSLVKLRVLGPATKPCGDRTAGSGRWPWDRVSKTNQCAPRVWPWRGRSISAGPRRSVRVSGGQPSAGRMVLPCRAGARLLPGLGRHPVRLALVVVPAGQALGGEPVALAGTGPDQRRPVAAVGRGAAVPGCVGGVRGEVQYLVQAPPLACGRAELLALHGGTVTGWVAWEEGAGIVWSLPR